MLTRIMGALTRRRTELRDKEGGFTLVELLVVVIIIGILAAIAIPVFIGIQNNAKDGAAKSDLANAKIAITAYYATGETDTPTTTDLANYGFTDSPDTTSISIESATSASAFCIEATATNTFHVDQSGGVQDGGC